MSDEISIDSLPTFKFHNDLYKHGHHEMLENNDKDYRTASIINEWKNLFINDVGDYMKSIYEEKSFIPGKLCRDWNSYINDIKEKINGLEDDKAIIKSELLSDIDKFSESIVNDSDISMCENAVKREYDSIGEKLLHDVCENGFYISDHLTEINNSPNCKKFQEYLTANKDLLDEFKKDDDSDYFQKNIICTMEEIEYQITTIHCRPLIDAQAPESRRIPKELHAYTEDFSGPGEEEPVFREDGSNSMDKILQIATPSALSVVGVSLIGFIFYKFTSFGRLFNNTLLKKKNNNNNLGEETPQFSEYTSEFEAMNFQNSPFTISYQPE
ncbi:PIR Superfamily Protein [Plasmodium ovale wallikeri]|uniref:PIR Superfamily Protein n=1 Tax=Plasmodium ovale wallikeri TaxID=864142 RepID=A0A1A9AQD7_PLAOA|nr:PIR Superfamily Protein [Plasmodium ovale wallikeri]SBT58426.1 PIR Superfamily Protein [Plasmodium ovale wallikeri]